MNPSHLFHKHLNQGRIPESTPAANVECRVHALLRPPKGREMYDPELKKISQTLREIPFPTRFAVEVTAACNLACSMCHHPRMKRPKGRMLFELWKKCADQVADASPKTECWFSFSGEPHLEPELLLRMLGYGKCVGLRSLNLNTNGMLLTPDLAGPILGSGLDLIVFGIDAFSRESYDKIRVLGDRDDTSTREPHANMCSAKYGLHRCDTKCGTQCLLSHESAASQRDDVSLLGSPLAGAVEIAETLLGPWPTSSIAGARRY